MKIETREFYYIDNPHDTLTMDAHLNIEFSKARPILWHNKSLFCIISRQKVQNIFDLIEDQKNLPVLNRKEVGTFHWDEGILIDARVANILLS